jgi:hypothetical protein
MGSSGSGSSIANGGNRFGTAKPGSTTSVGGIAGSSISSSSMMNTGSRASSSNVGGTTANGSLRTQPATTSKLLKIAGWAAKVKAITPPAAVILALKPKLLVLAALAKLSRSKAGAVSSEALIAKPLPSVHVPKPVLLLKPKTKGPKLIPVPFVVHNPRDKAVLALDALKAFVDKPRIVPYPVIAPAAKVVQLPAIKKLYKP